MGLSRKTIVGMLFAGGILLAGTSVGAAGKPNILVIWGDDIGQTNISAYTRGLVGYQTPNIDRIGDEGMLFTDYYGEQSCTAGRASFIMGQSVFRTGLSKVGLPGAKEGMQEEDPTIATVLKGGLPKNPQKCSVRVNWFSKNSVLGVVQAFLPLSQHQYPHYFS